MDRIEQPPWMWVIPSATTQTASLRGKLLFSSMSFSTFLYILSPFGDLSLYQHRHHSSAASTVPMNSASLHNVTVSCRWERSEPTRQSGRPTSLQSSKRLGDVWVWRSTTSSSAPPPSSANCPQTWGWARRPSSPCPREQFLSTSPTNGVTARGKLRCKAWRSLRPGWSPTVWTLSGETSPSSNTSSKDGKELSRSSSGSQTSGNSAKSCRVDVASAGLVFSSLCLGTLARGLFAGFEAFFSSPPSNSPTRRKIGTFYQKNADFVKSFNWKTSNFALVTSIWWLKECPRCLWPGCFTIYRLQESVPKLDSH